MNKSNKILIVVLTFIVVCVVGYALFSENITVTGSATAKGSFDITTTCELGLSEDAFNAFMTEAPDGVEMTYADYKNYLQGGYENDSCVVNENKVTLQTSLLYPSAQRYILDVVLPADIDDYFPQELNVYNLADDSLFATYHLPEDESIIDVNEYAHFVPLGDGSIFVGINKDNKISQSEEDFNENSMMVKDATGKSYFRIRTGEKIIISFLAEWDEVATDNKHYSQSIMTVELPFSQITNDMYETKDGVISNF